MADLLDFNAGELLEGKVTIEALGMALFKQILAAASGERTKAEILGIENDLVLFNPGPVT